MSYLRDRWKKIHNAPQMVIEHIPKDENDKKRVISYQMKQFLYTQDGNIRFSCSRNWLFQGYRKVWLNMVKVVERNEDECIHDTGIHHSLEFKCEDVERMAKKFHIFESDPLYDNFWHYYIRVGNF